MTLAAKDTSTLLTEVFLVRRKLLIDLASNFYLTGASLVIANALVRTGDSTLITALAETRPPEIADPETLEKNASIAGFDNSSVRLLQALTSTQLRAQNELDCPAGPRPVFASSRNIHQPLHRLWTIATDTAQQLLERLDTDARDERASYVQKRFMVCKALIDAAKLGATPEQIPELMRELPSWVQRRRHPRLKVNVPLNVWTRAGCTRGAMLDVSRGGALLDMDLPVERGEKIQLEFANRGMLAAHVKWANDNRVGVNFVTELDDSDALLLHSPAPRTLT